MSEKKTRTITVPRQRGAIRNFVSSLKLILKLMGDKRVSPWVKLIPIGAVAYWLSPVDLIMGIPGVAALDDAAVIWVGSTLFIELCPPEVVQELRNELNNSIQDTDDIVDAESTDVNNS